MVRDGSSKGRFLAGLLAGCVVTVVLGVLLRGGCGGGDRQVQACSEVTGFSPHRFEGGGEWRHFMARINSINDQSEDLIYVPIYDCGDYHDSMADPNLFTVLAMRKELTGRERFEEVARWLGRNFFGGDLIVLRDAAGEDGVLICDLMAKDGTRARADMDMASSKWYVRFQGSFGGMVTARNLYCNLLQPGLETEWVEAVRLVHIEGWEYDHVPEMNHTVSRGEALDLLIRSAE